MDGRRNDPERPRYMLRQTIKRNVAPTDVKRLFADLRLFHFGTALCVFLAEAAEMKVLKALIGGSAT
jgi:hypothetical protein